MGTLSAIKIAFGKDGTDHEFDAYIAALRREGS